jgi:hypothetical protein
MALLLPVAHVGHWLWALYLPPILIVLGSIVRTTISERRRPRPEEAHDDDGSGRDDAPSSQGMAKGER